jgi:ornithine cyclodeaminase/alanine dehydrogenase-like protein (mu-crystallin family)
MSGKIKYYSAEDIARLVSMSEVIDAMAGAFRQLSNGTANIPQRIHYDMGDTGTTGLVMPVYLPDTKLFATKLVAVSHKNPARGLPLIHATVLVADSETGVPVALMDGSYLTALRTGAASGLVSKYLSVPDARIGVVFGAGAQGRTQAVAIDSVRDLDTIYIADSNPGRTAELIDQMQPHIRARLISAQEEPNFVQQADIICTATTSKKALFPADHVKPTVHINGVGAYKPDMQEISSDIIKLSCLFVDSRGACLTEAGDIIIAMKDGLIEASHILAEIGEYPDNRDLFTQARNKVSVFKSVGNAVQDLEVAALVIQKSGNWEKHIDL